MRMRDLRVQYYSDDEICVTRTVRAVPRVQSEVYFGPYCNAREAICVI